MNRLGPAGEGVVQLDRRPDSTEGVVLVSNRRAEDRPHATVRQLLDRGAVTLEHRPELGKRPGAGPLAQLRVEAGRALGGSGHQNRDHLANRRGWGGRLGTSTCDYGGLRGSRRRRQLELGVLPQDGGLDPAQSRAGLDAELLGEELPCAPVKLESVRLAARPVEREHELPARALAQRVLPRQGFELGDELGRAPEREVGLDALLQTGEARLLEPCDLGLGEWLVDEVDERRPPPERQRTAKRRRAPPSPDRCSELAPSLLGQPLEHVAIALFGADTQQIAGR